MNGNVCQESFIGKTAQSNALSMDVNHSNMFSPATEKRIYIPVYSIRHRWSYSVQNALRR